MIFTMAYRQKILLHNNSKHEMTNIILKHEGHGASTDEIKSLKPHSSESASLFTQRLNTNTDVIFMCDWNGRHVNSVIYKKLNSDNLTTISFYFDEIDGTLKCSYLVSNDI